MSDLPADTALLPAPAPSPLPLADVTEPAAERRRETPTASPEPVGETTAAAAPARGGRSNVWRWLLAAEFLALIVVPWAGHRYIIVRHIYNFQVVMPLTDGADPAQPPQLLRCGQMSEAGLEAAIRAHGIKTVINLRWGAEDPEVGDGVTEKDVCDRHRVRYVFLPVADVVEEHLVGLPRRDGSGMESLVPWCVSDFLKIMDDPANRPVLLHCRVGKHRTGLLTAVWQLEQLPAKASGRDLARLRTKVINEMVSCGFLLDDRPVYWKERAFIESYQPRGNANSDLILPYLDRTVPPDRARRGRVPGPKEQNPFDEAEPAGNSRTKQ